MTIGIIVAMGKELDLLLPMLENMICEKNCGYEYYTGIAAQNRVIAVKSGIGKVNAALATIALIDYAKPDLIINTGVAGGLTAKTHPLDIIIGKACAYHDVWCGPGTENGQAYGCPLLFKAPEGLLGLPSLRERECNKMNLRHAIIVSGDIFISTPEEVRKISELYPDAMAVDMESAAIAQTCYKKAIPFIAIRVISDTPGEADNISQYNDFWEKAPKQTFSILKSLLNDLK